MRAVLRRIIVLKKKERTRLGVLILCITLIVGLCPNLPGSVRKVQAAELEETQFATKDQLLSNFKLDGSVGSNISRLRFGAGGRTWLIAGAEDSSTLALLSTSSFGISMYGPTDYYSESDPDMLFSSYTQNDTIFFSTGEMSFMKETTVFTLHDNPMKTDEDSRLIGILYAPNAFNPNSEGDSKIYVGSKNNIVIELHNLTSSNGFSSGEFWLRSTYGSIRYQMLTAIPDQLISFSDQFNDKDIVPAFHLDMSSVLFASLAPEASSGGPLPLQDSLVIRYASTALGTATISPTKTSIAVKGTGEKTFLVVQNADGAWAKEMSHVSGTSLVSVSDVTLNSKTLTSFADCKVWLETTDATERITTATMAVQGTGYHLSVTPGSNMTKVDGSGAIVQTELTGAMTDVVYTADAGYYFPDDYSIGGMNGITVTRNTDTTITISGRPTADVKIALLSATKKAEQPAPTGLSNGFNKILGTTTEMEYASSVDAVTWKACSNGSTEVPAGVWYVRYKETPTKKVGISTAITVTIPIAKYTITIDNDGNGTASANVTESVAGSKVSLTATANTGYEWKEWQVISGGVTITNDSFVMPSSNVVIKAIFVQKTEEMIDYEIMEGQDQTVVQGSNDSATIRVNGDFSKFVSVDLDGTMLSGDDYIAQSGSTIITLKPAFIKTLSLGKHTITIHFKDGTAKTSLVIKKPESKTEDSKDDVPKTGEHTKVGWLYVLALIFSGALVASSLNIRKIKLHKK